MSWLGESDGGSAGEVQRDKDGRVVKVSANSIRADDDFFHGTPSPPPSHPPSEQRGDEAVAAAPAPPLPFLHAFFRSARAAPSAAASALSVTASYTAPLYDRAHDITQQVLFAMKAAERLRFTKGVLLGLTLLLAAAGGVWLFRDDVKTTTAEQVADVAKRSLADTEVQQQAHELSQEVVHRILTDPTVLSTALRFTTSLLHEPHTQAALSALLRSLLRDESTMQEAQSFSAQLVDRLCHSESVQRLTADLVKGAIQQPDNRQQLISLMQSVLQDERSQAELRRTGSVAAHDVLNDPAVLEHMTAFTKSVLEDQRLQKTAGDALWSAVRLSFRPKAIWGNGKTEPQALPLAAAPAATEPSSQQPSPFPHAPSSPAASLNAMALQSDESGAAPASVLISPAFADGDNGVSIHPVAVQPQPLPGPVPSPSPSPSLSRSESQESSARKPGRSSELPGAGFAVASMDEEELPPSFTITVHNHPL